MSIKVTLRASFGKNSLRKWASWNSGESSSNFIATKLPAITALCKGVYYLGFFWHIKSKYSFLEGSPNELLLKLYFAV